MIETWKDIPNYEGSYQVSNLGNIKSLEKSIYSKRNKSISIYKEKILKPISNNGYKVVVLADNTKRKTIKIHQLVAMAFLNHKPNGLKNVVNHKDFNRQNNKVENLEIVTQRENSNKKHLPSSSKYVGVGWDKSKNKWISRIMINGKDKFLGRFKNEIDASNAYQHALKEVYSRMNKTK